MKRNLLLFVLAVGVAVVAEAQSGPYQFYAIAPCRVVDTRWPAGTNGGPALTSVPRSFRIKGQCNVPVTAQAVSLNVTVTGATSVSWVRLWPSGTAEPNVATINFDPSFPALGNGALVGLSGNFEDVSVRNSDGSVHVILDVTGYFQ